MTHKEMAKQMAILLEAARNLWVHQEAVEGRLCDLNHAMIHRNLDEIRDANETLRRAFGFKG